MRPLQQGLDERSAHPRRRRAGPPHWSRRPPRPTSSVRFAAALGGPRPSGHRPPVRHRQDARNDAPAGRRRPETSSRHPRAPCPLISPDQGAAEADGGGGALPAFRTKRVGPSWSISTPDRPRSISHGGLGSVTGGRSPARTGAVGDNCLGVDHIRCPRPVAPTDHHRHRTQIPRPSPSGEAAGHHSGCSRLRNRTSSDASPTVMPPTTSVTLDGDRHQLRQRGRTHGGGEPDHGPERSCRHAAPTGGRPRWDVRGPGQPAIGDVGCAVAESP